jgi:hypothetical protein
MKIFDRLFGRKTTEPRLAAPPADGPPKCPANPGISTGGRVAFTNGERRWTESFDLIRIAADVLRGRGHEVVEHAAWLELRPSGFVLQPLVVEIQPLEKGVRTATTMDVRHPDLIENGLFEYQHSTGDDVAESLRKGLEGWESVDLPVLIDALRRKPEKCTLWEMTFPAKDGMPARVRRAVLGNVLYFAEHPPAAGGEGGDENARTDDEHSFCNCCFLTRNFEAFRSQIEGDGCFGIRFYATRNKDGAPAADCRINGEDYEPGMGALRSYVATWPEAGFEFRKQYVFIHTAAAARP